jgi:hypothetical protein
LHTIGVDAVVGTDSARYGFGNGDHEVRPAQCSTEQSPLDPGTSSSGRFVEHVTGDHEWGAGESSRSTAQQRCVAVFGMEHRGPVLAGETAESNEPTQRDDPAGAEMVTGEHKLTRSRRRQAVSIFTHCGKTGINASESQPRHHRYARRFSARSLEGAQHVENGG